MTENNRHSQQLVHVPSLFHGFYYLHIYLTLSPFEEVLSNLILGGKIKTCFTNRLNKLSWFIPDWLPVKPLSSHLCPRDWMWPSCVERNYYGRRAAAAADHLLWEFPPKYHEESQRDSLGGAVHRPGSEGFCHLHTGRLRVDCPACEAEMLVLEALF